MQTEQSSSSEIKATTHNNIKRYRVFEPMSDYEVTLEVDHDTLTPELAQQINKFWTCHEDRAEAEDGDPVRTVIRMFGSEAAVMMVSDGWGGASFGTLNEEAGARWSIKFRDQEGWGGENDTPFGLCGIRIVAASAQPPGYDEFELHQVD